MSYKELSKVHSFPVTELLLPADWWSLKSIGKSIGFIFRHQNKAQIPMSSDVDFSKSK